jgi:hypothetical protein
MLMDLDGCFSDVPRLPGCYRLAVIRAGWVSSNCCCRSCLLLLAPQL